MPQRPWTPPSGDADLSGASLDPAATPLGQQASWSDPAPASPPWRLDDITLQGQRSGTASPAHASGGSVPPTIPTFGPPSYAPPPSPVGSPTSPPRSTGGGWRAATVALAATTLFAGGFAIRGIVDPEVATSSSATTTGASTVPIDLDSGEPAAEVARVLGPAVVQIERGDGLGSGVIYDSSGLILTNAHVVGNSRSADVRLADGTLLEGRVLGADESRDIAVVSVSAEGDLPVAELATEGNPAVGQTAIALGSPFGLTQSVTSGIVSAVDRPVEGTDVSIGMIQTDAPINPGNSGGALADRSGRVVGINAPIYSQSGENNGIGFAIPIDIAVETARRIVEGESLDVARIGVESATAGPADGSPGALVGKVRSGGAADDAGIEAGDVIVAVQGQPVISFEDLAVKISRHFPGDAITIDVQRDGKTQTLDVVLGTD